MAEKNVRFIRIRGRVVPIKIRREKVKKASIKAGAGLGIAAIGAKLGSMDLKKSFSSFRKGSDFAAMRKLVSRESSQRNRLIKSAAKFKVRGKGFARTGKFKIDIGLALGSILLGSAATDVIDTSPNENAREVSDEIGNAISTALTIGAIGLVGRRFRVRAKTSEQLLKGMRSRGRKMAVNKMNMVKSTGLKKRIPRGTQLEMFEAISASKKKSFLDKFLGKNK